MQQLSIVVLIALFFSIHAQTLTVVTDKGEKPVYKTGEEITFIFELVDGNKKSVRGVLLNYRLNIDGEKEKNGRIVTNDPFARIQVTQNIPGSVLLTVTAMEKDGKTPLKNEKGHAIRANGGAVVSPELIRQGMAEPPDFDEFWMKAKEELSRIPMKTELTPVNLETVMDGKYGKHPLLGRVSCFDVKLACAGNRPVSGYLVKPVNAKAKSLPGIVIFHPAGVRSAEIPLRYGRESFAFDVNAHGVENGREERYYRNLENNELVNYFYRGNSERDSCYFRNMYLRVMRALEFMKLQPEWDRKNLIVLGYSQGGAQAFAGAGLDDKVTMCVIACPALCDLGGGLAKRKPGWILPWNAKAVDGKYPSEQSRKIHEALAYYDSANFARRIKNCEIWVSGSCLDGVCPVSSVYAAFNNVVSKNKHFFLMDQGGHWNHNPSGSQRLNQLLLQVEK